MLPGVGDYYRTALPRAEQEVRGTDEARALGLDTEDWTAYLVKKYGMEIIEFDTEREVQAVEMKNKNGYAAFRVEVPVRPSDTLDVIFQHGLVGQPYYMWDYKEMFQYEAWRDVISTVTEQTEAGIRDGQQKIIEYVGQLNTAIAQENQSFPQKIRRAVVAMQDGVRAKHQRLDNLEKVVGVKIVKQSDVSQVVPTAIKIKTAVAALVPPTPRKPPERIVLDREKFDTIMDVIDQQCRQFELTPGSFSVLAEEGLRDVMLGSLNAIFRGAATGETFRGLGKADIHLRIAEGEVFVAELKFWEGPASLAEVVLQLRERLTWRDAYGVAILLARNADFGGVLRSVEGALSTLPGFAQGSLRRIAENRHAARFSLPSDTSKLVELHVVTYNLYTPRKTPRSTL